MTNSITMDSLVKENMPLIDYVISKFTRFDYTNDNPLLDKDDLKQIGGIGLVKAAKSYKEGQGSFANYAVTCIRNEISSAFSMQRSHEDTSLFYFDKGKALEDFDAAGLETADTNLMLEALIDDCIYSLSKKMQKDAKNLLMLISMGYKIGDAAEALNIDEARAYRIIRKVKQTAKLTR